MAKRDPRFDPQPGDILTPVTVTPNDQPREVTHRPPGSVAYRTATNRPITHCMLLTWREWCQRTGAKANR